MTYLKDHIEHEINLLKSAIELTYDKAWNSDDLLFITNEIIKMVFTTSNEKIDNLVGCLL